jgi:(4S)-4-hydroxy-5-phosphonooxypentane-2,3-dione isomerase
MFVVCVTIRVIPEYVEAFVAATRQNSRATRSLEPGNARFDVLRSVDDPTQFFLYEAYRDEAAFRAHQQTEHYLAWKAAVAPWMAVPRVGVKHVSVSPDPWE